MIKNTDEIEEEIERLKNSENIIIVEGIKDKKALNYLGLKNIVTLSKKPMFQIIEELSKKNKTITILTDFDKKGKQLYGRLNSGLQRHGVKVDNRFREFLQKNTKLSHIEGLVSYLNKIEL
ncbi:toprim domain-containing protein [Candidatus Woesearchaeota archaeon]|nr:toprim domain-containing protein [Candidatus Woesearchaeota archaeon]